MNKNEIQQKYFELQILVQQAQQLQKQVINLNMQINELANLELNLNSIEKSKINSESLISLGSGINVRAILKDNENALVNVGSGVVVEKSIKESRELINDQIKELTKINIEMEDQLRELIVRVQDIEKELS